MYAVGVFLLAWYAFLWLRYDMAPVAGQAITQRLHYPELANPALAERPPGRSFRVVLLGGSVLQQTQHDLRTRLTAALTVPVELYCLANAAHTTRDSMNKLQRLDPQLFDLIVVYHGINDVRMNCVPPDRYRDDYSHCSWYATYDRLQLQEVTPSRMAYTEAEIRANLWFGLGDLRPDTLIYGGKTKTEGAFRQNLSALIHRAGLSATPLVLMTFPIYIPDDYTRERFEAGALDYQPGGFRMPVESWGNPADVRRTVDIHNRVIRELAAAHPECVFVDQQAQLTGGACFSDVCHLTPRGIKLFIDQLLAVLRTSKQVQVPWKVTPGQHL